MEHIVAGGLGSRDQRVRLKILGGLSRLDIRQRWTPLWEHPRLDCCHGTLREHDEREIVRCVVDEIDQFRKFHGRESAEQQTDYGREC